jgi:ABC-type sulfate/molybdate transport systems ATPase subunit
MALRLSFTHPLRSFRASADLTVERGETVALVGPSGAGKTTVLRVVAGLLRPAEGAVTLDDLVLLDTHRGIDVAPEHRRVGYLFQEYALFPHLDVAHNVRFGARRRDDVVPLLDRFRITDLARARIHELSGGERQRVALARALANQPRLLLADEPTGALDTATGGQIVELLKGVREQRGTTVLLVTNDPDVADTADRILRIRDGRIDEVTRAGVPRSASA